MQRLDAEVFGRPDGHELKGVEKGVLLAGNDGCELVACCRGGALVDGVCGRARSREPRQLQNPVTGLGGQLAGLRRDCRHSFRRGGASCGL